MNPNSDLPALIANVIQARATFKVIAPPEAAVQFSAAEREPLDQLVDASIKQAGWAPFHYDRGSDGIAEPWRVDWLKQDACRHVAGNMADWFPDLKPNNKLTGMLSACGSLILVSWLPQFEGAIAGNTERAAQRQTDEEHLAATAAYVQNLLLLLTAQGLGTYWSSGGQFREETMFSQLGLQHSGRLLAAVFVDYTPKISAQGTEQLERIPGKHRDRRSPTHAWLSEIQIS